MSSKQEINEYIYNFEQGGKARNNILAAAMKRDGITTLAGKEFDTANLQQFKYRYYRTYQAAIEQGDT